MEKINLKLINREDYYSLESDSTIYARFKKVCRYELDLKQLQKERKELIKQLRSQGCTVSTKSNDVYFKNHQADFYDCIKLYKELTEELERRFNAIYKNGLYAPTVDNKELNDAYKIEWERSALLHRGTYISIFRDIKNHMDEIKTNMNNGICFTRVAI